MSGDVDRLSDGAGASDALGLDYTETLAQIAREREAHLVWLHARPASDGGGFDLGQQNLQILPRFIDALCGQWIERQLSKLVAIGQRLQRSLRAQRGARQRESFGRQLLASQIENHVDELRGSRGQAIIFDGPRRHSDASSGLLCSAPVEHESPAGPSEPGPAGDDERAP